MVKRIINALPIGASLQNGKYVILKALGQGSFGITYLAKTKLEAKGPLGTVFVDAKVAIKEFFMSDYSGRQGTSVSCSGSLHADYMRKFRREAEHLSHFRHDNIVKVLELFEENNTLYYVMEYIEGGSLNDHIPQNIGLPEQEALSLARQVGEALSYMHGRKALHLDLKPGNIMLRDDGRPVLIDFGLTKQYTEEGEPESSTTIGLGTRGYAPMEQANYQKDKTFAPTLDIYAFGATIFKMLTGLTPPEADRIFNEGFPTSWLTERKVSDATIQMVQKCMAPRKADRYQTIDAILKDISKIEGNKSDQTHQEKETEIEPTVIEYGDNGRRTNRGRRQDDETIKGPNKPDQGQKSSGGQEKNEKEKPDPVPNKNKRLFAVIGTIAALLIILAGIFIFKPSNSGGDLSTYSHEMSDTIASDTVILPPSDESGSLKNEVTQNISSSLSTKTSELNETKNESSSSSVSVSSATGTIGSHGYVDLGLSVKWATCNVGASSPEAYGSYFAWGETTEKETYTKENSKTYGESYGDISGYSEFDAARANWGSSWRLPTKAEFQELIDNCTWTWTTYNGKKGYKVVSKKNNNSIFLPAAGYRSGSSLDLAGEGGYYWSSTPNESYTSGAYRLGFAGGSRDVGWDNRCDGQSVRPVSE